MLTRVVRGRSFTLTKTFYSSGVPTDPTGTPTVTVTRDNGTAVTTGSVTDEAGVGVFSVTVPASQNTLLDTLTVDWAATVNGESQEYLDTVEVAGDLLFTIAEARETKPLDDTEKYPETKIVKARVAVEKKLEKACGVAFVPRYDKAERFGNGSSTLMLAPRTSKIRSVTVDDVAVTQSDIDTMRVLPTGEVYYPSAWAQGSYYVIAFEHGHAYLDPDATEAALAWVKNDLVQGPIDDRATATSNEFGNITLATPGMRGSISGIPAVDAFIQQNNLNVAVA